MTEMELLAELRERFYYRNGVFYYKKKYGCRKKGDEAGTRVPKYGGITIKINRMSYQRDRLVWLYHNDVLPYRNLKHINNLSADDRIENLYECTRWIQKGQEPKTRQRRRCQL